MNSSARSAHADKVAAALRELKSRGTSPLVAAPLDFRFMWLLGSTVLPPHFLRNGERFLRITVCAWVGSVLLVAIGVAACVGLDALLSLRKLLELLLFAAAAGGSIGFNRILYYGRETGRLRLRSWRRFRSRSKVRVGAP